MRNINFKSEITTTIILLTILFLFLRPSRLFMPDSLELMLTLFFLIFYMIFASLFWKERSKDERENLHMLNAGRLSFLIGSSVLAVGIFSQSLMHEVDPWLVYTLIAMLLTKTVSRIYSQLKN